MYRVVDMSRGILIINRIDQTTTWNILGNKNKLIYHLMEEIKYLLIVFIKKKYLLIVYRAYFRWELILPKQKVSQENFVSS